MQNLAQALKQWAQTYPHAPDLIVIIRGGGAVNDLAYLNDYALAALLCKRSVPSGLVLVMKRQDDSG